MTAVALPLTAITVLHASPIQVSMLAAASQIPWLILSLPAGIIVQRCALRRLQVALDLIRVVAVGSIPMAWLMDGLTYPHLLFAALITGSATVLFDIGNSTFLPSIVDKNELGARNSLISGTDAVTQTGGPTVSGLLIQFGGPACVLVVDSISYLVSAFILKTLPDLPPVHSEKGRMVGLIKDGWRFVLGHPIMKPCMLWATTVNFVGAALTALTPLYLVREADVSAAVVGIVVATDGVGALLGSAMATKLASRYGTARAMWISGLAGGALTLLLPLTTSLSNIYFYLVGNAAFSFCVVIGSIMARTHRQTESPPELLSRVMATVRFVSWGALSIGAAFSGLLTTLVNLHSALWIVSAGALVGPVALLLSPVGRHRDLVDSK